MVVDALDLEPRRERVMVLRHFTATQDVHLRLHGDRGAIWKAEYIDAVVRSEEWVNAVSKAACRFVWIESSSQLVLLLWSEHFRLALEDKKLMLVECGMDDFEIGLGKVVEVYSVDCGTKIDVAFGSMNHRRDLNVLDEGILEAVV